MDKIKDSFDEVPELSQDTATVVARPEHVAQLIKDAVAKEFACHVSNAGGDNMSDSNISKDWVERKTSDIDNKIEMLKVTHDARFERLISDSDIKFEKLMGEMNTKFAQSESIHTKWMVGVAFSLIAFTMATIGVATNLILKAIPASQAHDHQPITPLQFHVPTKQQPDDSTPSSPLITNKTPGKKAP